MPFEATLAITIQQYLLDNFGNTVDDGQLADLIAWLRRKWQVSLPENRGAPPACKNFVNQLRDSRGTSGRQVYLDAMTDPSSDMKKLAKALFDEWKAQDPLQME